MMELREATYEAVLASQTEGSTRSYERGFLQTSLLSEGHHARQHDVQDALRDLDPKGTKSRSPYMKPLQQGEFITAGPDFLWSIEELDPDEFPSLQEIFKRRHLQKGRSVKEEEE